jgi:tetratricopeptide (TPR) repeat protein
MTACRKLPYAGPFLLLAACALAACSDGAGPGGDAADPSVALIEQSLVRLRAEDAPQAPPKSAAMRQAEAAVLAGSYEQAERELRSVLTGQPGDPYVRFLLGISIHEQKLYSAAREHFEDLLREGARFPRDFNLYYYYGWCLLKLGELAGARRAFEAHLEFSPETGDSHLALGRIALDEGQLDEAQEHLQRALALSRRPGDQAAAHAALGDLAMEREDLVRARESFRASAELVPGQVEVYYKLAGIERSLGNEPAAREWMEEHERWSARPKEPVPGPEEPKEQER